MSADRAARPAPEATERLDTLESKLAFLDDLLEALNRTVFRQQQQIDQLALALAALGQQIRASTPANGAHPQDELPPHY
jgi:SlyX protein